MYKEITSANSETKFKLLNDNNFLEVISETTKPVIVLFYEKHHSKSIITENQLHSLTKRYSNSVSIFKFPVQEESEIINKLKIKEFPALIFIENGWINDIVTGSTQIDELRAKTETFINNHKMKIKPSN